VCQVYNDKAAICTRDYELSYMTSYRIVLQSGSK